MQANSSFTNLSEGKYLARASEDVIRSESESKAMKKKYACTVQESTPMPMKNLYTHRAHQVSGVIANVVDEEKLEGAENRYYFVFR